MHPQAQSSSMSLFEVLFFVGLLLLFAGSRLNGCNSCNYTWYPRGHAISLRCPSCGSTAVTLVGPPLLQLLLGAFVYAAMFARWACQAICRRDGAARLMACCLGLVLLGVGVGCFRSFPKPDPPRPHYSSLSQPTRPGQVDPSIRRAEKIIGLSLLGVLCCFAGGAFVVGALPSNCGAGGTAGTAAERSGEQGSENSTGGECADGANTSRIGG